MNLLIGPKTKFINVVSCYWNQENALEKQFQPFLKRSTPFLNLSECEKLLALTYLNESQPFGKVDAFSTVGMVSTSESYNELFIQKIESATQIVCKVCELKLLLDSSVKFFVPLIGVSSKDELRSGGSGKSAHWLKGAIFLSLPTTPKNSILELALNIVHELGHQILMVYQDADQILINPNEEIYSSVRKTKRPAIMSFHALIAVYFMLFFLKNLSVADEDQRDFINERQKILYSDFVGGAFALKDASFTPVGLALFHEMLSNIEVFKKVS
ncbi:MAG: hypothetical protein H7235_06745 [Bdellovibrionaceae bacterium]|nr:hypothetical protein [Pseudobdellovibrionaceae bacterium]